VTLTPNAEGVHPDLLRARELMGHGRLRAAARACAQVLENEPDNVHAIALKARLDAATHVMTVEQAQSAVAALITLHPDDTYLRVASAILLVRGKDRSAAIAALRQLSEDNPSDAYIHQALAGQLGCQKSTWDEALVHYKLALGQGPLLTPAYRAAAYHLAKRKDPRLRELALSGAGGLGAWV
jgi:predicted Zn-dependent protease